MKTAFSFSLEMTSMAFQSKRYFITQNLLTCTDVSMWLLLTQTSSVFKYQMPPYFLFVLREAL